MIKLLRFNENKIVGGLSDNQTIKSISLKHGVSKKKIRNQVRKGIKVEREHTKSNKIAREIAMDHLFEFPDYYDRLEKLEKNK